MELLTHVCTFLFVSIVIMMFLICCYSILLIINLETAKKSWAKEDKLKKDPLYQQAVQELDEYLNEHNLIRSATAGR